MGLIVAVGLALGSMACGSPAALAPPAVAQAPQSTGHLTIAAKVGGEAVAPLASPLAPEDKNDRVAEVKANDHTSTKAEAVASDRSTLPEHAALASAPAARGNAKAGRATHVDVEVDNVLSAGIYGAAEPAPAARKAASTSKARAKKKKSS